MLTVLDVSMWQGDVNWRRVHLDGIDLVMVKATEGTSYVDPRLEENRRNADALGIRVGCYHFADPSGPTGIAQAHHFCSAVHTLGRRDLKPALDLETGNPGTTEELARSFNRTVAKMLGVLPLFYSNPSYIGSMHLRRTLGNGLWLASYGRNDADDHGASVPGPWKRWVAHQFTSVGHYAGVAGHVDVSHAPKLTPLLAHPILGRK